MPNSYISILCTFLMLFPLQSACIKKKVPSVSADAIPVELDEVRREAFSLPVRVTGLTAFDKQMRLAFKTGGYIAFLAAEGPVRQGTILARLDTVEIAAQVRQARQAFEKAQRDYRRALNLHQGGALTDEQRQNAETAFHMAEAALEAAEFNLEHSTIRALENGSVLKRLAETGELVGPGMPVLYFGAGSVRFIQAALADRDVVRIRRGDSADVMFDALSAVRCSGRITRLSPMADPQTGLWEIQVTMTAPPPFLPVGLAARLTLFPAAECEAAIIPVEAVVEADGDQGAVFIIDGGVARQIPVTLGLMLGDRIVITEGLQGIDSVVTLGAGLLRDGAPIRPSPSVDQ